MSATTMAHFAAMNDVDTHYIEFVVPFGSRNELERAYLGNTVECAVLLWCIDSSDSWVYSVHFGIEFAVDVLHGDMAKALNAYIDDAVAFAPRIAIRVTKKIRGGVLIPPVPVQ